MSNSFFSEKDLISVYTRKQALEDGELVDVTKTASEAGFRYATAVTRSLHAAIVNIPAKYSWEDVEGRLWDVIWMARGGMLRGAVTGSEMNAFKVILHRENNLRKKMATTDLTVAISGGDQGEPVITIGFPQDF